MKLTAKTCYSHILWMLCSGPVFKESVSKFTIVSGPHYEFEGMAGYIETDVEFEISNLEKFTPLWCSWYSLPAKKRLDVYGLAKGLGDCK